MKGPPADARPPGPAPPEGQRPGLATPSGPPVLEVEDLTLTLGKDAGPVTLLQEVKLRLSPGRTVGLVGESGCGKSLTALAILGLLPPEVRVARGRIVLQDPDEGPLDLLRLPPAHLRRLRGRRIGVVFQEPRASLNPTLRAGEQIAEVLRLRGGLGRSAAAREAEVLLERMGLPSPGRVARSYPHQLSGGMQQRVGLAMALALKPLLLIADEPTTALDVTVQHGILELLRELQKEEGLALLFISHDVAVVAGMAESVAVMYAGRVVEVAPVLDLFRRPLHPYTAGLLRVAAAPGGCERRFPTVPGTVPPPDSRPKGCAFADRCPFVEEACRRETPLLRLLEGGRLLACPPTAESRREPWREWPDS